MLDYIAGPHIISIVDAIGPPSVHEFGMSGLIVSFVYDGTLMMFGSDFGWTLSRIVGHMIPHCTKALYYRN